MTRSFRFAVATTVPLLSCAIAGALALPARAQQPAPDQAASDQAVLTRGLLDALRANTDAIGKNAAALDALTSSVVRAEAALRSLPPSVEGARTDVIAIRTALERLAGPTGIRRPAATLKFGPFACGDETEASCAGNACKSVGYRGGVVVAPQRSGSGPTAKTVGINEATCYD